MTSESAAQTHLKLMTMMNVVHHPHSLKLRVFHRVFAAVGSAAVIAVTHKCASPGAPRHPVSKQRRRASAWSVVLILLYGAASSALFEIGECTCVCFVCMTQPMRLVDARGWTAPLTCQMKHCVHLYTHRSVGIAASSSCSVNSR